ncbi:MAG: hypothetical protein GEU90_06585 [Gemmatimonas sp.]|nr:hypothetical protein [Gemmatimonas sp.]
MRFSHLTLASMLLGVIVACAATTTGGGDNPNVLTYEELQSVTSSNSAYEAIRLVRPQWLRSRGVSSFSGEADPIVVYVDNVRYGEAEALQSMSLPTVESIERIDATSATQRWGTGHAGGVLAVTTRRGG